MFKKVEPNFFEVYLFHMNITSRNCFIATFNSNILILWWKFKENEEKTHAKTHKSRQVRLCNKYKFMQNAKTNFQTILISIHTLDPHQNSLTSNCIFLNKSLLFQTVLFQLVLCFWWPKKSAVRGPSVIKWVKKIEETEVDQ